jgi:hypothetical protein
MSRQSSKARIASRQERAAGRVLEDEGLRGDLADDEFQPLLDWALAETDRVAASTDGMADAKADALIDRRLDAIREIVRSAGAAIAAHGEGDGKRRAAELAFIGDSGKAKARFDALAHRLDKEPDLTGVEVATAIVEALGTLADDQAPARREEKGR